VSGSIEPDRTEQGGEGALRRLVERARGGDVTALPELRRLLDENAALWRAYGDLARHAEESLIAHAAGADLLLRESLRRKVAELKAGLGPNNPLERLLVDRVAACWVAASHADAAFGQAGGARGPREGQLRRRQDSASRRLTEAIRLLATVRRLLGPRASPGGRRGDAVGQRDGGAENPAD
jgi:hypothetical protein